MSASSLFVGVYPTGLVFADRAREHAGDYLRLAFLPFSTLELEWSGAKMPQELRDAITAQAAALEARRGEPYQISAAGQTVTLGGAMRRVLTLDARDFGQGDVSRTCEEICRELEARFGVRTEIEAEYPFWRILASGKRIAEAAVVASDLQRLWCSKERR